MEFRTSKKIKQLIFQGLVKFNCLRFLFRDRFLPPYQDPSQIKQDSRVKPMCNQIFLDLNWIYPLLFISLNSKGIFYHLKTTGMIGFFQ